MFSLKSVVVVLLFFVLNTCLSMLNRWALGIHGFSFPVFLTMFQAMFTFICVFCVLWMTQKRRSVYKETARKEWKGIILVGLCLSVNIVLNNCSLVHISLSLNQVLRASMPLVTATIASIEQRKLPDPQECLGLVVLSGGVALAIGEASATGSMLGVILCLLSVIAAAFMLLVTAKTLHSKLTALQLAFLTAPITFLCLLPPFVAMESSLIVDYISSDTRTSAYILVSGSILALVYNVVHNDLVAITGPVTTTVLGQIKIILLMLLSGIFFGEGKDFSMRMSIGCAIAILGFSMYSWAQIRQQVAIITEEKVKAARKRLTRTKTPVKMKRFPSLHVDTRTPPSALPGLVSPLDSNLSNHSLRSRSAREKLRKSPGSFV